MDIMILDGAGDRRQTTKAKSEPQHLTIAQSIRRSSDPHHAAVAAFTRRETPHPGLRIYYFEDGSFLSFEVNYVAVEDGGRS